MTEVEIPEDVENIIFDLGGVILNVDYTKTAQAFIELGCQNFNDIYSQQKQSGLFDLLETGKISPQAFINELLRLLPSGIKPKQVIDAWNAMLLDLPDVRIRRLKEHKNNYRTFLLSNTNAIHEEAFTKIIQKENHLKSLDELFERVYFSHQIGLRKPNKDVFEFVLNQNKLNPEKTLFIDDSPQHLEGAKACGINTIYYKG